MGFRSRPSTCREILCGTSCGSSRASSTATGASIAALCSFINCFRSGLASNRQLYALATHPRHNTYASCACLFLPYTLMPRHPPYRLRSSYGGFSVFSFRPFSKTLLPSSQRMSGRPLGSSGPTPFHSHRVAPRTVPRALPVPAEASSYPSLREPWRSTCYADS